MAPADIRLSKPDEVPAIHRVWRASVDATHGFIAPIDIALYEHLLLTLYLPQKPQWLALAEDGAIQGFIGLSGPKIETLFVHPDWHRKGVGQRLITHALSLGSYLVVDVNSQNPGGGGVLPGIGIPGNRAVAG